MLTAIILIGLLAAGAIIAAGWLHWRGLVHFGQRGRNWGAGTMVIGSVQVLVWAIFPGGPELWLRLAVALAGALLFAFWIARRQGAHRSPQGQG